jgi:hypothetical protein
MVALSRARGIRLTHAALDITSCIVNWPFEGYTDACI